MIPNAPFGDDTYFKYRACTKDRGSRLNGGYDVHFRMSASSSTRPRHVPPRLHHWLESFDTGATDRQYHEDDHDLGDQPNYHYAVRKRVRLERLNLGCCKNTCSGA